MIFCCIHNLFILGFLRILGPQPLGGVSHPNVRFNQEFIAAVAASFIMSQDTGLFSIRRPREVCAAIP